MRKKRLAGNMAIGAVLLALCLPTVRGKEASKPQPNQVRVSANISQSEAASILDLLYRGNTDSAYALASSAVKDTPSNPLALLMKARVMRERLREHDDDKSLIKKSALPINDILVKTIGLCDSLLGCRDPDPSVLYYRGWARMFKAQVDVLSGSYWSAGQEAKNGKKDLEKYLEFDPDHADAKGLLGIYLYFVDTAPSIVKIIKSVLLIPGGDRDKGLEYLDYASNHSELLKIDHIITYLTMFIMFEGRFEEGIEGFMALHNRFPDYQRIVEFLVLMAPFSPRDAHRLISIGIKPSDYSRHRSPADDDSDALHLIRYQRSYSGLLFTNPAIAQREFETIIESKPDRPDWYYPLTLMNYGVLEANSGNKENAVRLFQTVLGNTSAKRFHQVLEKMIDSIDLAEDGLDELSASLVESIYSGNIEEAGARLETYRQSHGETIHYYFYSGEFNLLSGREREAIQAYYSTLEKDVPEVHSMYRMYAATRLAEIMGAKQEYDAAGQFLETALDYYQKELFIDMLIKARKRFYSNLDSGTIETPSTNLISGIIQGN